MTGIPVVLSHVDSLEAETSAITTINANTDIIQAALAEALNLTTPNQLNGVLDMNGFELINLPPPVNPTDVVRLVDAKTIVGLPGPAGPPGPTGNGTGDMLRANNLSDVLSAATARTNLGLTIGTNVQAWSSILDAIVAANPTVFGESLLTLTNAAALQALLTLGAAARLNVGTASGTVAAGNDVRFYNLPYNLQNGNYTFQPSDRGTLVVSTGGSVTWTIPNSGFNLGDTITVRAGTGSGGVTIARGSGVTLTKGGSTTNQNVAIAAGGVGTIIAESTNTWFITGAGLT